MKVNWMPRAVKSFFKIGDFLEENFGEKQTDEFIQQVGRTIERIQKQTNMYKATKKETIRKGFVNKYVSLFYKVKTQKKEIDLLEFWDNRQDPKKQKH